MKNFETRLNDHKLSLELLYCLIKTLFYHLKLDYKIERDTSGYVIKIKPKKNGRKNNTIQ